MAIDQQTFNGLVSTVIDNLEGGYFNQNMFNDGRISAKSKGDYATSGETMFGIDRKNGGEINTSPAGVDFWKTIDASGAANNWKWNYKGGDLAPKLKSNVAQMMYPEYTKFSNQYLSPQASALVDKDPRLGFHFVYGVWNGPGWFQKFAKDINSAVANGVTDTNQLSQIAINSRASASNSLVSRQAGKISDLFGKLGGYISSAAQTSVAEVKKHPYVTIALTAGIIVTLYLVFSRTKKAA